MDNPTNFNTLRLYVFAQDKIPFAQLTSGGVRAPFEKRFGFQKVAATNIGSAAGLGFDGGAFKTDTAHIPITTFFINGRAIYFVLAGKSEDADKFFDAVVAGLKELDSKFDPAYLQLSEDTNFTATLSLNFSQFFDARYLKFLAENVPKAISVVGHKATTELRHLQSVVNLNPDAPDKVPVFPYGPRPFIIEPRVETPLSERRFYVAGPTRTDSLIKLVSELEALYVVK